MQQLCIVKRYHILEIGYFSGELLKHKKPQGDANSRAFSSSQQSGAEVLFSFNPK